MELPFYIRGVARIIRRGCSHPRYPVVWRSMPVRNILFRARQTTSLALWQRMRSVHWEIDDDDYARTTPLASLVDYLARLDWCQNVKAKEGCSARSPGTLLAQPWAAKGVFEHHEHPPPPPPPTWLRPCIPIV